MGTPKRKQISPERFALARLRGATWEESALRAGYAQTCARRGRAGVSNACLLAWDRVRKQHIEELRKDGAALTPEEQVDLVRGKLIRNLSEGKDESVQSCKMLGQDRRVNLFVPDHTTGVFVLEMPAHLVHKVNATVLAGELAAPASKQLEAQNATRVGRLE